jgi:chromosome segregation ATPase
MDNQNLDETSIDYQVMCSICNKPSIDSRCLPCGHSFCGQCIERWIEENHTSCPICSQAVPMRNLLEVDRVVREKVNDLPVKPYENEQTTLHNHSTNDDRNIVSSAIDEHSLFSDMTRQRNEQEGQSSTALHFEPLRAILSELILQNKQLKEQIKQFEKQNQNLTKKNEELHIEIAQLKKQSIEHKTRLNQLETNDQNYNTKILEIDQRHNLLERNIKSVKHRVTNLTSECLILFRFGET